MDKLEGLEDRVEWVDDRVDGVNDTLDPVEDNLEIIFHIKRYNMKIFFKIDCQFSFFLIKQCKKQIDGQSELFRRFSFVGNRKIHPAIFYYERKI